MAILLISRANYKALGGLYRSLEEQQLKLEEQAAELRWRKAELETQVLARTEDLQKTNKVIYDANLQIAEKNLEIAWQNEEMEKTVAEIKKIELDLVESDKLASIGMFAQGISQNITGPLDTIRTEEKKIRALATREAPERKQKINELTDILGSGIGRIDRIIGDLGKLSASNPDATADIRQAALQAFESIKTLAGPQLPITIDNLGFPVLEIGRAHV